jgi:glycosyltransferase involved in cell wall biosynthesis
VIGSALGGVRELIDDGRTGLLFRAGDAKDLAAKVRWAFAHREEMDAMRVHARREYEAKFTAERNYGLLMEIYESAMERARARRGAVEARTAVAS